MPIRPNPLLSDMARQALWGGDNGPASLAALFDWLQEHPVPSYESLGLQWWKGRGHAPRWVYEAVCSRTGYRDETVVQLCRMESAMPDGPVEHLFRRSLSRATLSGTPAWLITRSHTNDFWPLARLAWTLGIGLFLAHCPERRRFPWLLGWIDWPSLGLQVHTHEE